jgi:hypothetical protein
MSEKIQNRMMTNDNTEQRGAPIPPAPARPLNEGAPIPPAPCKPAILISGGQAPQGTGGQQSAGGNAQGNSNGSREN